MDKNDSSALSRWCRPVRQGAADGLSGTAGTASAAGSALRRPVRRTPGHTPHRTGRSRRFTTCRPVSVMSWRFR